MTTPAQYQAIHLKERLMRERARVHFALVAENKALDEYDRASSRRVFHLELLQKIEDELAAMQRNS